MKDLNVTCAEDLDPCVDTFGDPDTWVLICKASCLSEGWMKSTKAMNIPGGIVLQVSTYQNRNVSEAIVHIPGCKVQRVDGVGRIFRI